MTTENTSDAMKRAQGGSEGPAEASERPLSLAEYKRYGRQMILPQFGLDGQVKLKASSVLVVGAGGLGCPAVQYLAAAGVGHVTIVDHDDVEMSNLARQILHTDERVGMNKAKSAAIAARAINPHIRLEAVTEALTTSNAVAVVSRHDLVLDCTDNVLTRYLISDAAVLCGVQVVSGAAQGLDGQLVVLHKDLTSGAAAASSHSTGRESRSLAPRGPCYRCLFPKAPRPEDVTDCEDGGVLGGVTGLVGTMQALEAVKLLVGMGQDDEPANMTLVSPLSFPPFRAIKIRPRRTKTCVSCGIEADMSEEDRRSLITHHLAEDKYISFCGLDRPARGTKGFTSADVGELLQRLALHPQTIIDVRPPVELGIARLNGTQDIPLRKIDADPASTYKEIAATLPPNTTRVLVICRKGNDSRIACEALNAAAAASAESAGAEKAETTAKLEFVNVSGGLRAWSDRIDPTFPVY